MNDDSKTYSVTRSHDGQIYVLRLVPPRFTVQYIPDALSNIKFIDIRDEFPLDAGIVARFMREIGDEIAVFLQTEKQ